MLGLDGVEIGLIIVFLCLFSAILSGFPVAFAIGGAAVISFGIIAALNEAGLLIHMTVDTASTEYAALLHEGIARSSISVFRYPDLPTIAQPVFAEGLDVALKKTISAIVNRMNERVLAGQSIETLLAVAMFVLMGITLERSKIAEDLLTTMARVFGPLPGGLAVSVVVVGAFLAASTGIVGATVVTMGLLSLPTMLRNGYSPQLSTGVIAASGTLGQIIPPSIVIVLLGTLVGDIYATAQEARAQAAGCTDALTYLGEPAVVSVGTLFQAALLPGILLAFLYALYAFVYALFNPEKAPAVHSGTENANVSLGVSHSILWFLCVPVLIIGGAILAHRLGFAGGQSVIISSFSEITQTASLRTNVSEACAAAMQKLHGMTAWQQALSEQANLNAAGGITETRALNAVEKEALFNAKLAGISPLGTGIMVGVMLAALTLAIARGVAPLCAKRPLLIGVAGLVLVLIIDGFLISPITSAGQTTLMLFLPSILVLYGCWYAVSLLQQNDLMRVVFPPLVLIVAVLGSILGGITNPTPAAALGAGGAIMLAAYRLLRDDEKSGRIIITAAFCIVIMIIIGVNFDLRITQDGIAIENKIAWGVARFCYLFSMFGLLYACWVLLRKRVMKSIVRETAKVTSMVFTILIGSQLLNLVVISFGGEHYIQDFLRSFDNEWKVFIIVMLVLFILGFVLDFLEIIYIVVPIVGPVIYGGTLDPKWVTIMIAVNLQTSFLTPPFGFALFYLRGVAPKEVTTRHIYAGIIPFTIIQVLSMLLLAFFPQIVTFVPDVILK